MRSVDQCVDAGDVLVVGAGAAGVLSAVEAVRAGYDVTVLDRSGVAAEQSGHSHGLIHHGSLYVGNDPRLIAALREARAGWAEHLHGIVPSATSTVIPVWDAAREFQARQWWRLHGLEHEIIDAPAWLRGDPTVFRTSEASYDFTPVFERLVANELDGRTFRMDIERINIDGGRVVGVDARRPDGSLTRLVAGAYVLAAGVGLAPLLERSGIPLQRLTVRTSFMLVLAAEDLPAVTMMLVEQGHGGLFTGTRQMDGETRWLVGDHLSLALDVRMPQLENEFVHAIVARLRELTTVLEGKGVRVGVYSAPKAELRDDPNDLSPFAVDSFGLSNALVTTPTKITLAPALARATLGALSRLDRSPRFGGEPLTGEPLVVRPERWTTVTTYAIEELAWRFRR